MAATATPRKPHTAAIRAHARSSWRRPQQRLPRHRDRPVADTATATAEQQPPRARATRDPHGGARTRGAPESRTARRSARTADGPEHPMRPEQKPPVPNRPIDAKLPRRRFSACSRSPISPVPTRHVASLRRRPPRRLRPRPHACMRAMVHLYRRCRSPCIFRRPRICARAKAPLCSPSPYRSPYIRTPAPLSIHPHRVPLFPCPRSAPLRPAHAVCISRCLAPRSLVRRTACSRCFVPRSRCASALRIAPPMVGA